MGFEDTEPKSSLDGPKKKLVVPDEPHFKFGAKTPVQAPEIKFG